MNLYTLKFVVAIVGLTAVAVFALGPTLGLNINPENLLQNLAKTITTIIDFLSKIVEGLLS